MGFLPESMTPMISSDESVGSSASPGVGRSVYSLDERLGLRKVATRTSVAVV